MHSPSNGADVSRRALFLLLFSHFFTPATLQGWGVIILTLPKRKVKEVENYAQIHVPGELAAGLGQELGLRQVSRSVGFGFHALSHTHAVPGTWESGVSETQDGKPALTACPVHKRLIGAHQEPGLEFYRAWQGGERGLILETVCMCVHVCGRGVGVHTCNVCVYNCT